MSVEVVFAWVLIQSQCLLYLQQKQFTI
jgi:hypothetical protein